MKLLSSRILALNLNINPDKAWSGFCFYALSTILSFAYLISLIEKIENEDDMEKLMKHLKMTGRRGREKKLLQKIKNALHNERPPKCSF